MGAERSRNDGCGARCAWIPPISWMSQDNVYVFDEYAPPNANWTRLFSRGEKVRLRFSNGSSMSFFDVRIPGLKLTVLAHDGDDVEPITVTSSGSALLRLARSWSSRRTIVHTRSLRSRSIAPATLAPRSGMQAEIPPLDERPPLTIRTWAGARSACIPRPTHRACKRVERGPRIAQR